MTTDNIRLYKLSTRYRKSWHYANRFDDFLLMRLWLEKIKNPNRDLYGFYRADINSDSKYGFSTFYLVVYQDIRNIVVETFINDVIQQYPFVKGLLNNDRL